MLYISKSILLAAALAAPTVLAPETSAASTGAPFEARLLRPSNLGLQLHALKDGPAAGVNGVVPLWGAGKPLLLAQGYGFKGDGELGGFGAGLILRYRLAPTRMVEANAFVEGLRSREGFSYPQLGAGLAYSESWFTARVNGYFPLRGGQDRKTGDREWTETRRSLDGSIVAIDWSQAELEHLSPGLGFDAELELHLPEPPRWIDPRLVLGYFYRESDDGAVVHFGALVRGELHFGENWSMEAEWRDDAAEIGQEFRFVLRYQHWFGGAGSPDGISAPVVMMDRAMRAPVERQPWPTVTRVARHGKARAGEPRLVLGAEPQAPPVAPDDCCPSGGDPLIFD